MVFRQSIMVVPDLISTVLICGFIWLAQLRAIDAVQLPSLSDIQKYASQHLICCDVLAHYLPGEVSTPINPAYTTSLLSYWSQQEQQVSPACVVTAKSAQDVATAVYVLKIASQFVKNDGCLFAVRSGGHTPFAGAANIQNGVTIDLQSLNQVDVSQDKKTVALGPGNRWGGVYLKLDAMGLATSGGRVAIVGVGGLVLGGGISFFSPRYGFDCDNAVNFEIVLASGQIVNANASQNTDLFKALKGGSNNFGIVTRLDMRLFPQGKFWGGFIGQPISTRFAQFQYFEAFANSANYDPYAALINSYVYTPATDWIIASNYEYTKPQAYPPVFKNFTDLPQIFNTMRISNLSDFTIELAATNPAGSRNLFATGTFKNNATTMQTYFDLANSTLQAGGLTGLKSVSGLVFSLSFQALPQTIISKAGQNGGNSLGLDASDGDLVNVLLTVQWKIATDDAKVNAAAKDLFTKAEAASKASGTYNPYLYLNYAASWQKPISGYGAQSVAALKAVSDKYDPGKLVQNEVPGGFKLDD